jgi:hypothetical protein
LRCSLPPVAREESEEYLSGLRQKLSREGFDAAWRAGAGASIEQAVEDALDSGAGGPARSSEASGGAN